MLHTFLLLLLGLCTGAFYGLLFVASWWAKAVTCAQLSVNNTMLSQYSSIRSLFYSACLRYCFVALFLVFLFTVVRSSLVPICGSFIVGFMITVICYAGGAKR